MIRLRWNLSLKACGFALWLGCLTLLFLSSRFAYEVPAQERPIALVVSLLLGMFGIYLLAIRTVTRNGDGESSWSTILSFAIAMRLVALFSTPIQELDYYRYLWDGETVLQNVSPFEYSPEQVLLAHSGDPELPDDLRRLVKLRDRSPRVATIVSRVHYGELASIYPPVSLTVFSVAAATTPNSATVETAIVILKGWILLFDIGIILLLADLLRSLRLPVGLTVIYAWCPLVIKEFANSGHLDAIAVFFMVWAASLFVKAVFVNSASNHSGENSRTTRRIILSGLMLGLAIGAKLFPVVLVPLFLFSIYRKCGVTASVKFLVTVSAISLVAIWPLVAPRFIEKKQVVLPEHSVAEFIENTTGNEAYSPVFPPIPSDESPAIAAEESTNSPALSSKASPPIPGIEAENQELQPPPRSLKVFLSQWKMNDLVFMFVESNLSPDREGRPHIWFAVVPTEWRKSFVQKASSLTGIPIENVAFLITRISLSVIFIGLAFWWSWRAAGTDNASEWLRYLFLTLAWFWILSPTLNPWYWTWAIPFLAFSRSRSWLLVSGLLFLYYLRFWFAAHWEMQRVWGTPYAGEDFFHYVFVWCEHLPWMLALGWESFGRKRMKSDSVTG